MCFSIASANQKGGVGKTTNGTHLAAGLAERGLRGLIWDLDMNHGATSHLGIPSGISGSFEVLSGARQPEDVILSAEDEDLPPNLDLLPANRSLENLDAELFSQDEYYVPWLCLREPLARIRALNRYQFIILDTGPSAQTPTRAAYMEADYFMISVRPEKPAIEGMQKTLNDIEKVQRPGRNPKLQLLGVLLSDVDTRQAIALRYRHALVDMFEKAGYGDRVFKTEISRATALPKAWHAGKTLFQYDPEHRVVAQFRQLTEEVLQRVRLTDSTPLTDSASKTQVASDAT
jgi:chromosome partitioning protein